MKYIVRYFNSVTLSIELVECTRYNKCTWNTFVQYFCNQLFQCNEKLNSVTEIDIPILPAFILQNNHFYFPKPCVRNPPWNYLTKHKPPLKRKNKHAWKTNVEKRQACSISLPQRKSARICFWNWKIPTGPHGRKDMKNLVSLFLSRLWTRDSRSSTWRVILIRAHARVCCVRPRLLLPEGKRISGRCAFRAERNPWYDVIFHSVMEYSGMRGIVRRFRVISL